MHKRAGILIALVFALTVADAAPARVSLLPHQAIAPCGWLKLEHGGLLIFHGYYTTPCRRAAEVLATFWRSHRHGQGSVGRWRCERRGNEIVCNGPKRQWASSGWEAGGSCPRCGHVHLPPGYRIQAPQG
jgi:hypothetical protein